MTPQSPSPGEKPAGEYAELVERLKAGIMFRLEWFRIEGELEAFLREAAQ